MTIRKLLLVLLLFVATPVLAETIAIIGTGNVGMALGTELAQQGHTIVYGSRSPLGLKAMGVAKKTRSQSWSGLDAGSQYARSTTPRRLGNMWSTRRPASPREVTATIWTSGWQASRRSSSTPV